MTDKDLLSGSGSALLPTVNEPGTYDWCIEVVECMNAAWHTKEDAERGFLLAVAAAIQYRIWETLSPPPPEEPYESLDGLIRRTAETGQAENMQIAIRFSGLLEEIAGQPAGQADAEAVPWAEGQSLPASAARGGEARLPVYEGEGAPQTEEDQVAMGNALLDQYYAQMSASALNAAAAAAAMQAPVSPKRSAALRKRDKLDRLFPELSEAVDAGEMTLKQAYLQAGIDKEVQTVDKLQKLWKTASEEDRDRFLSWIDQQEHWGRRHEYEKEVYGEEER